MGMIGGREAKSFPCMHEEVAQEETPHRHCTEDDSAEPSAVLPKASGPGGEKRKHHRLHAEQVRDVETGIPKDGCGSGFPVSDGDSEEIPESQKDPRNPE